MSRQPVLVIGGAGFIGANLADRLLRDGETVVVFDNLSRPGVETNLAWLRARHGGDIRYVAGDIRDAGAVAALVGNASAVFHLAAQVAVTSSFVDPLEDFTINAQGTLNVLEAVRRHAPHVPVIFSSTNKVYGGLEDVAVALAGQQYLPVSTELRAHGIGEDRPLHFCTPYGCSKGAADQYVLDYARSFGLRTATLRMSCIYGPRQFGTEDQGWVAHFLIRALRGEPITIYGDGRQTRDILYVEDAVAAYCGMRDNIDAFAGESFNLGGGPENAVSLRMVLDEITLLIGRDVPVSHTEWRTGDQRYFVADTRRIADAIAWRAQTGWREGLRNLAEWVQTELDLPVAVPA